MKKLLLLFLFGLILNNTFAQFDRNFKKVSVDSINARTEFVYINDNVFYKDTLLSDYITFYAAGDVVNFGTANQIPFMNATGTDFGYSSNFQLVNSTLYLTNGNSSVGIGRSIGVGSNDVVIGDRAGSDMSVKGDNVIIGLQANRYGSGLRKITIGYLAGYQDDANDCIYIGKYSGRNYDRDSTLAIDVEQTLTPLIYGEFDNNLVKINGDFKVQDDTLEVTADTTYIRNKLKVTGGAIYLDGRTITPATASAYIETGDEAATTISATDTYYFLKGTFTNKDAYNFAFDGDTLQYVGTDSIHVVLHYTCTFGVGQVNTKVTTGVSINDVIAPQSVMERTLSATTDRGSWAGLATLTLGANDKIKLVVKADKTGTVTAYRFSTIIKN